MNTIISEYHLSQIARFFDMVSISFSNAYLNIYTLYIDEDSTHKVCKYIPTLTY